jgi:hypothetical protein
LEGNARVENKFWRLEGNAGIGKEFWRLERNAGIGNKFWRLERNVAGSGGKKKIRRILGPKWIYNR